MVSPWLDREDDAAGCVQEETVAVRIRLKRVGRRHRPSYRLAAFDGRRARDSKVIEELGSFDPITTDADRQVVLNRERIEYWLSVGAQPSDTVRTILKKQGIGRVRLGSNDAYRRSDTFS